MGSPENSSCSTSKKVVKNMTPAGIGTGVEEYENINKISIFLHSDEVDQMIFDLGSPNKKYDSDGGCESVTEGNRELSFPLASATQQEESSRGFKVFEILVELLTLIFTMVDMIFVGILVYRHYMADEDPLQAYAMLLPIFLSTFGVQLFFEKYPPEKHWYNEILNVPLLGPIFCTGELLYSKLLPSSDETIRIEAESIKLKQYESIFRAYPEGMVMLSVLFINHSDHTTGVFLKSWMMEIICVIFAIIGLAEAHCYAIVSDFYRIHNRGKPNHWNFEDRERPHKLQCWQKFVLFLHAASAIGLRVFCEGLIRATLYFTWNGKSTIKKSHSAEDIHVHHTFTEVLLVVFFCEMVIRSVLHLIAQIIKELSLDCYKCLLNPFYNHRRRTGRDGGRSRGFTRIDTRALDGTTEDDDEEYQGIHGAVKHGFLATFSPLQFQSKYLPTVLWFYIENLTFLTMWFILTRKVEVDTKAAFIVYDKQLLLIAVALYLNSIIFQGIVSYLKFPDSDIYVVRIRRVPHRYLTALSFPSVGNF